MTKLFSDYTKYGSKFSTVDISAFGILEGISETIVSTGLKYPNAAPIGIIVKDERYFVRLFRGSHTWANVLKEGYMTANVIYNSLLFVRSTFFDLEPSEFDYVTTHKLNFPILKEAAAWIIFKCINVMNTDQTLVANLIPMDTGLNDVNKKNVMIPNRGFNAVLEATVHATRYQLSGDKKYLELIQHYGNLAFKCGGENEKKAMKLLHEVLEC